MKGMVIIVGKGRTGNRGQVILKTFLAYRTLLQNVLDKVTNAMNQAQEKAV